MMSDKDYELLERTMNKMRAAKATCSGIRLDHNEVRVIIEDFDYVNRMLMEFDKIMTESETKSDHELN